MDLAISKYGIYIVESHQFEQTAFYRIKLGLFFQGLEKWQIQILKIENSRNHNYFQVDCTASLVTSTFAVII